MFANQAEMGVEIMFACIRCGSPVNSYAGIECAGCKGAFVKREEVINPIDGIAKRLGLNESNYQSYDLLLDAIHRKIDSMAFELDAYRGLMGAETVDDKEIF